MIHALYRDMDDQTLCGSPKFQVCEWNCVQLRVNTEWKLIALEGSRPSAIIADRSMTRSCLHQRAYELDTLVNRNRGISIPPNNTANASRTGGIDHVRKTYLSRIQLSGNVIHCEWRELPKPFAACGCRHEPRHAKHKLGPK